MNCINSKVNTYLRIHKAEFLKIKLNCQPIYFCQGTHRKTTTSIMQVVTLLI